MLRRKLVRYLFLKLVENQALTNEAVSSFWFFHVSKFLKYFKVTVIFIYDLFLNQFCLQEMLCDFFLLLNLLSVSIYTV